MYFDFAQLIVHVTTPIPLNFGNIIASGTISNEDRSRGFCCLTELRTIETIETASPKTTCVSFGDTLSIDMFDASGNSNFAKIKRVVQRRKPT
jgi:fumarylacetoacetate (FAA) hydrolase